MPASGPAPATTGPASTGPATTGLATTAAERDDLRAMVRAFVQDRSPLEEVRRLSGTEAGYDPGVWADLGGQLGLPGLLVPAGYGGAGCGLAEAGVVLQELGRGLASVPYLSSAVLAVTALLASGDEVAQAELLPGLATGDLIGAVAVSGPDGRADGSPESLGVTASHSPGGTTLDGEALYVADGHVAGVLLVAARDEGRAGLYRVAADAPGLSRTVMPVLDATRKLTRLGFSGVPAYPLGPAGSGPAALGRVLDTALVALAAEAVGGAEQALDLAVSHARQRVQFGRPIGSFQAIKHKCADMLVALEGARVALDGALLAAADSGVAALVASLQCSAAYTHITAEAIQVLGGIGFTWEHPAHLYFRRARTSAVLFGTEAQRRATLAGRLRL
jgi:alkylation response protein AidB-like acyl-CoA dehydrogenase